MAIVKMKRFRLIALEQDLPTLLTSLQRLGSVEVGEAEAKLSSPEWSALLRRDSSSYSDVKSQISQLNQALDALRKYAPVKSGLFVKRSAIAERDFLDSDAKNASLKIAAAIGDSLSSISRLHTQENRLTGMRASLVPWSALQTPLSHLSTEHVFVTLGVCPAVVELNKLTAELQEVAPLSQLIPISSDKDQHYLLFLCHNSQRLEGEQVLKTYAFSGSLFKDLHGTASDEIARIDAELLEIEEKRAEEESKIASFGDTRPQLRRCLDVLNQELAKESTREHLLTDGTIVFLEGWAAQTGLSKLERELGAYPCAYSLEEPEEEATPPTLLKNPKWMSCINMVTEMYSLPAYRGGIDPNPLIFGFYILFFGFMFADIGYGIILAVVCGIITKVYRPKKTMGYMFHLGIYLGISACFFGIITGGFFGDALTVFTRDILGWANPIELPYLINPLQDPMSVLALSIVIGIVQLIFGQCIHIYMGFRDGKPVDGLLDVLPWWALFAGIAVVALTGNTLGIWIGVGALVLTQGRHKKGIFGKLFGGIASLYDVTSWLSDILSYCRLMALMLASSVIASVMNILGALPRSIIAFAVVFIIGHVFNIAVNLIGTYVHAARLQYLEFFGKFYLEGGIPFRPLKYETKYVDITTEEDT